MEITKQELIDSLTSIIESTKTLPENIKINIDVDYINTGLVEMPKSYFDTNRFKEYKDLGGKSLTIKINIPNFKYL